MILNKVNDEPIMANTIIIDNQALDCKGIDFGGRNVIILNDNYGHHDKLQYLINGNLLNEKGEKMFSADTALTTYDLDSRHISGAYQMFSNCTALKTINMESLSSLTDAEQMFYNCTSLTDLSVGDMNSLVNMKYFCYGCNQLSSITIGNLPVVSGLFGSFYYANHLQNLTIGDMPTIKAFYQGTTGWMLTYSGTDCTYLRNLKIGNLDSMQNMDYFVNYNTSGGVFVSNLKTAEFGKIDKVTGFTSTFAKCSALTDVTLGSAPSGNVSMIQTFSGCNSLSSLTIGNSNNIKVSVLNGTFSECHKADDSFMEHFDFSNVNSFQNSVFKGTNITKCPISAGDFSDFDYCFMDNMYADCSGLVDVTMGDITIYNGNLDHTFARCPNLKSISFGVVSGADLCDGFIEDCPSLTAMSFDGFYGDDGSFSYDSIFSGCNSLKRVILKDGEFPDTSNIPYLDNFSAGTQRVLLFSSPISATTINILNASGDTFDVGTGFTCDNLIVDNLKAKSIVITVNPNVTRTYTLNGTITGSSLIYHFNDSDNITFSGNLDYSKIKSSRLIYDGSKTMTSFINPSVSRQSPYFQIENVSASSISISGSATTFDCTFYSCSAGIVSLYAPSATTITGVSLPEVVSSVFLSFPACTGLTQVIGGEEYASLTSFVLDYLVPNSDADVYYNVRNASSFVINSGIKLGGKTCNISNLTYQTHTDSFNKSLAESMLSAAKRSSGDSGIILVGYDFYSYASSNGYISQMLTYGYTVREA